MSVWGLILSALGAGILAWGQSNVARSVHLWLTALELGKDPKNSRSDIYNVVADTRMKKAVRLNQWLTPAGWVIFVLGIVLQIIPYFRQHGLAALGFS